MVWLRCRRVGCPDCGPVEARQTATAIAIARPTWSYLFTLAGEDWQTRRARVRRVRYRLRQRWPWLQDCWHVEPNPRGTGHHVHGLLHSALPDELRGSAYREAVEVVRGAVEREGLGSWVGLRPVRDLGSAAVYGLKMASLAASAYGLKEALEPGTLDSYLTSNGGRLVHTSRGFWRDGEGRVIRGSRPKRTALQRAVEASGRVRPCPVTGSQHRWSEVSL